MPDEKEAQGQSRRRAWLRRSSTSSDQQPPAPHRGGRRLSVYDKLMAERAKRGIHFNTGRRASVNSSASSDSTDHDSLTPRLNSLTVGANPLDESRLSTGVTHREGAVSCEPASYGVPLLDHLVQLAAENRKPPAGKEEKPEERKVRFREGWKSARGTGSLCAVQEGEDAGVENSKPDGILTHSSSVTTEAMSENGASLGGIGEEMAGKIVKDVIRHAVEKAVNESISSSEAISEPGVSNTTSEESKQVEKHNENTVEYDDDVFESKPATPRSDPEDSVVGKGPSDVNGGVGSCNEEQEVEAAVDPSGLTEATSKTESQDMQANKKEGVDRESCTIKRQLPYSLPDPVAASIDSSENVEETNQGRSLFQEISVDVANEKNDQSAGHTIQSEASGSTMTEDDVLENPPEPGVQDSPNPISPAPDHSPKAPQDIISCQKVELPTENSEAASEVSGSDKDSDRLQGSQYGSADQDSSNDPSASKRRAGRSKAPMLRRWSVGDTAGVLRVDRAAISRRMVYVPLEEQAEGARSVFEEGPGEAIEYDSGKGEWRRIELQEIETLKGRERSKGRKSIRGRSSTSSDP